MIQDAIQIVTEGQSLTEEQMFEAMDQLMQGGCKEKEIAAFLSALHEKGETVDELVGAAKSMRKHMNAIECGRPNIVDTCGTGGGNAGAFNISTAAAIVAAAAGATVAKHGNRASTSKSGSADVLKRLGVNIECSMDIVRKSLEQVGLCFCYAPLFHPSVKNATKVRKKLGHPTIFNLLGPLCNPAKAPFQLLGAGRGETRELLANALSRLDTERSLVVHGKECGLGELSNVGPTDVSEVRQARVAHRTLSPADFGYEASSLIELQTIDAADSADKIRRVLAGQKGAARDVVVINAAAALWVSGISEDLRLAVDRCEGALDNGHAKQTLEDLIDVTNK